MVDPEQDFLSFCYGLKRVLFDLRRRSNQWFAANKTSGVTSFLQLVRRTSCTLSGLPQPNLRPDVLWPVIILHEATRRYNAHYNAASLQKVFVVVTYTSDIWLSVLPLNALFIMSMRRTVRNQRLGHALLPLINWVLNSSQNPYLVEHGGIFGKGVSKGNDGFRRFEGERSRVVVFVWSARTKT